MERLLAHPQHDAAAPPPRLSFGHSSQLPARSWDAPAQPAFYDLDEADTVPAELDLPDPGLAWAVTERMGL